MQKESIRNEEGKFERNCVIYASTTRAEEVGLDGGVAAQARNCVGIAKAMDFRIMGFFRDISVGLPIVRVDLERLFGFVFNPRNEISTVVIVARDCLSLDQEQFTAIQLRLNCLGIDLFVVEDEIDVGDYGESMVEREGRPLYEEK